ncbi:ABC transporter permease [Listeria weihenstephanensis]|uniref:ABC transporter permease n=1 Tax=Listeria weihenstephanensis TaxID=1006155 RepID=A0A841Z453_9LIST|nr:ABC transporter permease [Listeria weihenstephanensis]MBC1500711.1 ABC transporter permease [Listeria weihenstephanensis]
MQQIGWIFRHNFKSITQSKGKLLMIIGLPILSILIYFVSYGAQSGTTMLKIGLVNEDPGVYTSQMVMWMKEDSDSVQSVSKAAGDKKLTGGQLDALVIFEKGSEKSIAALDPQHITVKSMQGDTVNKTVKATVNASLTNIMSMIQASEKGGQDFAKYASTFDHSKISVTQKTSSNQQDVVLMMSTQILGFLCMMLLYAAGNLGELILQEKEDGTFYRLMSTPLSSKAYLFGNALFSLAVVVTEVVICLTAMRFVFGIDPGVSYLALFGILFVFSVMAVLLSLALGFTATSRKSVSGLQMILFTLTSLLSGALIPVEIMPAFMQKVAEFLPQYWVMNAITTLQQNGGLASISLNIAIILGYALLFFCIASYKFTKNNRVNSFV